MTADAKIFISYSRRNREFAERLFEAFVERGYDPWVDFDDIPFSVDWWQEIKTAIDSHDVVINIVSEHSLISRVCNEEITYARERNKRIIPLIVDEIDIKSVVGELYDQPYEMTARDNWKYVRTLNWIYFHRENDIFEERVDNIIDAMETDHVHLRSHTRLLTRGLEWKEYNEGRGFLLRGEELNEAEEWLAASEGKTPVPLPLHDEYIKASREVQEADEQQLHQMRRQTRLLRRASVGLIITAIVVIGVVLAALYQSGVQQGEIQMTTVAIQVTSTAVFEAQETVIAELDSQSQQAISLRLAVEAQGQWDAGDPLLLSLPLGLAAFETVAQGQPPLRVQRIVSEAVYSPGLVRFFSPPETPAERECAAPGEQTDRYAQGIAHTADVGAAVITEGNRRVISGGLDRCLYIWDAATGNLLNTVSTIDSRITALALAPDEETFAVGDNDGVISIWDLNGEPVSTLTENGHDRRITGLAYTPDGSHLLSGALDERLIFWNVGAGTLVHQLFEHGSRVTAVAGHPNRMNFITGDTEGSLIYWRFDNNNDGIVDDTFQFVRMETAHERAITTIAFSQDGQNALTAELGGTVVYWQDPQVSAHNFIGRDSINESVVGLGFLDNRYGVFGTEAGNVLYWDLTLPENGLLDTLPAPVGSGVMTQLSVSKDKRFATLGFDNGVLILVELENGAMTQQIDLHEFIVQNSVIQPDGTVVSREFNEDIVLWDPGTQQIARYTLDELNLDRAVLVPGGQYAVAYTPAEDLVRMDVDTLEQTSYPSDEGFINNTSRRPTTVGTAFSPGGQIAMSVPFQGNAPSSLSQDEALFLRPRILWNTRTGQVLNPEIDVRTLVGEVFTDIAINGNGTRFAVVHGSRNQVSIFDIKTLDLIETYARDRANITDIAYGTEELPNVIVLGYADGSVGFLQPEQNTWLDLRGHNAAVFNIDLKTQDGRMFAATSSEDQSVLVWDVTAGEAIRQFVTRTRGGDLVIFGSNGDTLISQSAERTVVWRLDTAEELIAYARNNRFVLPLSEGDCDTFQIPEPCGD